MSALRSDPSIAPQEIFSAGLVQGTDLGARFTTGDGRVFRYALGSGTALIQGKVYQSPPQDTTNWQKLGVSVAAGTGTFVVTTGSSVTLAANFLSGGILSVRSSTGSGFTYGIKSHAAVTAGTVAFTLSDPLQNALATTSVIDVTPNAYSNIVVAPTTLTGAAIGVAVYPIPGSNYGWIQTRGLCNVLSDGAITVGLAVSPSVVTAGALAASGGTQVSVGAAAITTTTAVFQPFNVTFE